MNTILRVLNIVPAILLWAAVQPVSGQIVPASPSNWLYPMGNSEATRYQAEASQGSQSYDSLDIKWVVSDIYGDVAPLIGNVVSNERLLPTFSWGPNELVAITSGPNGRELVIIGGDGKRIAAITPPSFVTDVSVLFDSLAIQPDQFTTLPVVMGLQVLEHEVPEASGTSAYIATYLPPDPGDTVGKIQIIKRLTTDLRPFAPNNAAGLIPVFGRNSAGDVLIYSTISMSSPIVTDPNPIDPPYFRGLALFQASDFQFPFPRPDVLDDQNNRYMVGPDVSFSQPSITVTPLTNELRMLLPCKPTPLLLNDPIFPPNPNFTPSFPNKLYLFDLVLGDPDITQSSAYRPDLDDDFLFSTPTRSQPRLRPYYVRLTDPGAAGGQEGLYILLAEEFEGRDGSFGLATLHLLDAQSGLNLTLPPEQTPLPDSSYTGDMNHSWSVAVGNVDGFTASQGAVNGPLPSYPNSPGREIIVSQSIPRGAFPGSRLSVLRYDTRAQRTPKQNIANQELMFFDTIATQKMSGWIAAVNDFDGDRERDEIFLVDNGTSTLKVVRMRYYNTPEFILGDRFETVYERRFPDETIYAVMIADLDGDGLNDIVVTTSRRTYCIGKPLLGRFVVTDPVFPDPFNDDFCSGDTVSIRWLNQLGGVPFVNIFFQPYAGGVPAGQRQPIIFRLDNPGDTGVYHYVVDSRNLSGTGRFVVESFTDAGVRDSTAIVTLNETTISLNTPLNGEVILVGRDILVSGTTTCADEVLIQVSTGATVPAPWDDVSIVPVAADGSFSDTYTVPCFPVFDCFAADEDLALRFRAIAVRFSSVTISDTSGIRQVLVRPDTFSLAVDPPADFVCPERTFRWSQVPMLPECDSLSFALSTDSGRTFSLLERVAVTEPEFIWRVLPNLPDTVLIRFCCDNACARAEMEIVGTSLRYVDVVAPNPFDPENPAAGASKPGVNIVYTVPRELRLTVRVLDQSNRVIAVPVRNETRIPDRTYCDNWDGIIAKGSSFAPNGMYYIVMEFSNGDTEVFPVYVAKGY